MTDEHKRKISEALKLKWSRRTADERVHPRPILWVEAGKVMSMKDLAAFFECSIATISKVLNGKQKRIGGLTVTLQRLER